jgi:tetratricopeptide (TPR) repeat protein
MPLPIIIAAFALAAALFGQDQTAPAPPQYFDEPNFIVAGVADPAQRGGHGSDPVLRSAESLAKSTAALRTGTSVADAAEKQGKALEAAREYQRAAELDPNETNLFDWGTELLTHRAADQAVEVFTTGHRLFPRSIRMLLGLAVALYSRGSYDQAAQRFFEAADLNPSDPAPYLFLGNQMARLRTPRASRNGWNDLPAFSPKMPGRIITMPPLSHEHRPRPGPFSKRLSASIPNSATHFCCSELSTPKKGI